MYQYTAPQHQPAKRNLMRIKILGLIVGGIVALLFFAGIIYALINYTFTPNTNSSTPAITN
jgi:uncharacterized membrane protein required for colicin V production